jgi:hypothetical protein
MRTPPKPPRHLPPQPPLPKLINPFADTVRSPPLSNPFANLSGNSRAADVTYEFGPVGDFVLDTGSSQPSLATVEGGTFWVWKNPSDAPTVGLAHSIRAESDAHSKEFLAGVLLGLAGAALIAALQELLKAVIRLREDKAQAPDAT